MRKLLRITAVAGYRGKRYRDEKSLAREALEILAAPEATLASEASVELK